MTNDPQARPLIDSDLVMSSFRTVQGGESRAAQLTGTKALMLAVLEDGIRCYLGKQRLAARDAEFWITSSRRHSPFSFLVVCEVLGLDADAVRLSLSRMKQVPGSGARLFPRARHNVRVPGKVYPRRPS